MKIQSIDRGAQVRFSKNFPTHSIHYREKCNIALKSLYVVITITQIKLLISKIKWIFYRTLKLSVLKNSDEPNYIEIHKTILQRLKIIFAVKTPTQ